MNPKGNQDVQTSASAAPAAQPALVDAHAQTSASSTAAQDGQADTATDDSQRYYDGIVYDAVLTLQPNGCNETAIANCIEQRHKVPENFRRSMGSRLRRLVADGRIKKVQKCYQITENKSEAKEQAPLSSGEEARAHRQIQSDAKTALERAAEDAAQNIVVAEQKEYMASQAAEEVIRVSAMAETAEVILQLAENVYEECKVPELLCESQYRTTCSD